MSYVAMESFFKQLKKSQKALLLIDYDGTLAPFVSKRNFAKPYLGVEERLEKILLLNKTKMAIVTGRSIADFLTVFNACPKLEIFGSHGVERMRNGKIEIENIQKYEKAIQGLTVLIPETYRQIESDYLEEKPFSLAIHWRGLEDQIAAYLKEKALAIWQPLFLQYELEILPFNGGLELRPQGISKANAVRKMLSEVESDSPLAYLGDDLTDEEAFEAIADRGLKVLVSKEKTPTHADVWIKPPQGLLNFLDEWLACQK